MLQRHWQKQKTYSLNSWNYYPWSYWLRLLYFFSYNLRQYQSCSLTSCQPLSLPTKAFLSSPLLPSSFSSSTSPRVLHTEHPQAILNTLLNHQCVARSTPTSLKISSRIFHRMSESIKQSHARGWHGGRSTKVSPPPHTSSPNMS